MRKLRIWLVFLGVIGAAITAGADGPLDCSKKSLADAVKNATGPALISFTGICVGQIEIATDGLVLKGIGTAIIDGGGQDAVTIIGASRVALVDLEVTNGVSGIVARNGSHISLSRVTMQGNSASALLVQSASTAVLAEVAATSNGKGLTADDGAGITARTSSFTGNTQRDIQLTFGTRADLQTLSFATYTCDATVLVRGNSGIVCPH